jgi:hypothetical protein
MLRPQLIAIVVLVALWGGTAHAWRMVCEADPAATPVSVAATGDDVSPRVEELAPPPLPVAPVGHDVCILGSSGDASCWPDERLPVQSGHLFFASFQSFTVASGAPPPGAPSARLYRHRSESSPLSSGHERRLERPPRAV